MGKSVKKLVKKAGPVIGATVGFVACGGNPVCASVGAGIGGLAGGHGVGKSLMYAGGAYLGTGGTIPGLGSMGSMVPSGYSGAFGSSIPTGAFAPGGGLSGIGSLTSSLQGGIGKGLASGKGMLTNVFGGGVPGQTKVADPNAYKNLTQSQQIGGSGGAPVSEDPGKFSLVKNLFNKLNSPLGVLGATTALGYLGAKQRPDTDPTAQARKLESEYMSPVDIKYGTKFSSAPGQKVKGLFYNPVTLQFQDTPYTPTPQFARGGVMSIQDFPRKLGHISGPGTATSDSVPALLSDGEFVMTADAVKGIGNGSRRDGAKKMYNLMNQFERRAVA